MKNHIKKTLLENMVAIVTYQSKKLSTKFNVKDKTEFYHQSNLVYYRKYPNQTCTWGYTGEKNCRIKERITDHNKHDKNSHILKHSHEKDHSHV